MKTEQRLKELGIELAKPTSPMANYVNAVRTGNLLYLVGQGPGLPGKPLPVRQGRPRLHDRGGLRACARDRPQPDRGDEGRAGRPRSGQAHRQGAGHGQLHAGVRQPAEGDQRLLRPLRRGVRRARPSCPLGGRHGLAAARHPGRDRGDRRGRRRGARPPARAAAAAKPAARKWRRRPRPRPKAQPRRPAKKKKR